MLGSSPRDFISPSDWTPSQSQNDFRSTTPRNEDSVTSLSFTGNVAHQHLHQQQASAPQHHHGVYHPMFGSISTNRFPSLVKKSPSGGYVLPSITSDHGYSSNHSPHSSTYSTNKDELSTTLGGVSGGLGHLAPPRQSSASAASGLHFQYNVVSPKPPSLLSHVDENKDAYPYRAPWEQQRAPRALNPLSVLNGAGDIGAIPSFGSGLASIAANATNGTRRVPGAPSDPVPFFVPDNDKEIFARKVFVGGLPIDVKEEEIYQTFSHFGPVLVDWPRRPDGKEASTLMPMTGYGGSVSNRYMTGYVFLVFEDERSVQLLVSQCHHEGDRYYLFVSSPTMRDKPVQVRPWRLSDMDYCPVPKMNMCPRRTVFIGGVPRPTRAGELAEVLDRLYGPVCYVGIDIDPELKYPKGAARVTFSTTKSFVAAISGRFVQIPHADNHKRVEIKPYVMDEQMCDECEGRSCSDRYAPYFCGDVSCLQYFCESCWDESHYGSSDGSINRRHHHKPLVRLGDQTKMLPRPPHHNIRGAGLTGMGAGLRTRPGPGVF